MRKNLLQNLDKTSPSIYCRGGRYLGFLIEWIFCWIEYSQIQIFGSIFELNFPEKRLLNNLLNWIFGKKLMVNNIFNLILLWSEWMDHLLNRYFQFFYIKPPIFCLFWTLFGHSSNSTSINDSLTIELNFLLNWITRVYFELNNIWIELWVSNIESNIKLNHFLAKLKHWIESDSEWVSELLTRVANDRIQVR